jgi:hypothetical protein
MFTDAIAAANRAASREHRGAALSQHLRGELSTT